MTPCPVVSLLGEYPMLLFHGPHLSMIANRRGLSHVLTKLFVWLQLILPVINRTTRFKEPLTFCGFLMPSAQVNSLLKNTLSLLLSPGRIGATLLATGRKLIEFVINSRIRRACTIAIKPENRVAPVTAAIQANFLCFRI
jgi:hypothetical protein